MKDGYEIVQEIGKDVAQRFPDPDDIDRAVGVALVQAKRDIPIAFLWDELLSPLLRRAIRDAHSEASRQIVTDRRQRASAVLTMTRERSPAIVRDKPRQPARTFGSTAIAWRGGLAELVDGKQWGKYTLGELAEMKDKKRGVAVSVLRQAWIAGQLIASGRLQNGDTVGDRFTAEEMDDYINQAEQLPPDGQLALIA